MSKLGDLYKRSGPRGLFKWAKDRGLAPLRRIRNFARRGGHAQLQHDAAKKIAWLKAHKDPKPPKHTALIGRFDGLDVPQWMIDLALAPARKAGVKFTVISGVRSPAYSEQLCYGICGAPTCPGRCAGRSSNHAMPPTGLGGKYEGAVDVYPGAPALSAWCRAHGNPIIGGGQVLPSDPNHFSRRGN